MSQFIDDLLSEITEGENDLRNTKEFQNTTTTTSPINYDVWKPDLTLLITFPLMTPVHVYGTIIPSTVFAINKTKFRALKDLSKHKET